MAGNFQAEFTLIKVIVTLTFQLNIRKKTWFLPYYGFLEGKLVKFEICICTRKFLTMFLGTRVWSMYHIYGMSKV